MKRTQFLLAAGLLCCSAFAQVKPDFSGTWKLNNGKSTQDGPADRVYVTTVQQTRKNITVSTKSEGVTNVFDGTYPIAEKLNTQKQGDKYRSTRAYWEGATLIFELIDKDSKKDTAKTLFYVRESWTMSLDGRVITKFRQSVEAPKVAGERGNKVDQKYVFDKQ